ncbi:MAG: DNA-binding domain-containing protein [Terracidiphilus sp.]
MNLLEFQRRMAADVMRPLTEDESMREYLDDGSCISDRAATYIKPNRQLSPFERLEIYNRQYWFRVLTALTEDYPALEAVVGAERFEALARAYLAAHPSRSFTLRNLGSHLPGWLSAHPQYAGDRHELAIDVARLEWAYAEAFDLAEAAPLNAEELARLDDGARIGLQPHMQLLALHYPVDDLVIGVHRSRTRAEVSSKASSEFHADSQFEIPPVERCNTWLAVHRYEIVVYYRRLAREEYELLHALHCGSTLGEALESAFQNTSMAPQDQASSVGEWFANWAEFGWLCSFPLTGKEITDDHSFPERVA